MTKLEGDLKQSLIDNRFEIVDKQIIGLAEVAKKYIKDAFVDGYYGLANIDPDLARKSNKPTGEVLADQWLKDNGITE